MAASPMMATLGQTGIELSRIGFGAFKIGRNEAVKYPQRYALPDEDETRVLLQGVLEMGVNYIDTAPAYGESERRIGALLADRMDEFVVSTKVGEQFVGGRSFYDFSREAVRRSLAESRTRLRRDVLDLVFVHSNGDDVHIQQHTDVVQQLVEAKCRGDVRAIGFSGKTVAGAALALEWADAIMVEYHLEDSSHEDVMRQAGERGVGVIVKKALASGRLDPQRAIAFAARHAAVTSVVVGTLSVEHLGQAMDAVRS